MGELLRTGDGLMIIGRVTVYRGTEIGPLKDQVVRIFAVLPGRARDPIPDAEGGYFTDELEVERAGGVTADDRIEVQPWIEEEKRYSWVTYDPRAVDLECFQGVGNG